MSFLRELARILFFYVRRIYYSIDICLKDIYRLIEDRIWDARLKIRTCYDDRDLEERAAFKDEVLYRPTSYHRIRRMIEHLKLSPEDVFVDYGCGKGRAVLMFCRQRLRKIIGVELQTKLAQRAEDNLKRLDGKLTPAEIVHCDAADFNPDEGTVFFLYDPFKYRTFLKVVENLRESFRRRPRKMRVVYFDERFADVLDAEQWLKREGEIGHTRILVWSS